MQIKDLSLPRSSYRNIVVIQIMVINEPVLGNHFWIMYHRLNDLTLYVKNVDHRSMIRMYITFKSPIKNLPKNVEISVWRDMQSNNNSSCNKRGRYVNKELGGPATGRHLPAPPPPSHTCAWAHFRNQHQIEQRVATWRDDQRLGATQHKELVMRRN